MHSGRSLIAARRQAAGETRNETSQKVVTEAPALAGRPRLQKGAVRRFVRGMDDARITIEPGKRSGPPSIRGLRVIVWDVLGWLAAGKTEQWESTWTRAKLPCSRRSQEHPIRLFGDFPDILCPHDVKCGSLRRRPRRIVLRNWLRWAEFGFAVF